MLAFLHDWQVNVDTTEVKAAICSCFFFFFYSLFGLIPAVSQRLFNGGGQELWLRSKVYLKRFSFPTRPLNCFQFVLIFFGSRQPLIDQVEIKCRHQVAQTLPSLSGSQHTHSTVAFRAAQTGPRKLKKVRRFSYRVKVGFFFVFVFFLILIHWANLVENKVGSQCLNIYVPPVLALLRAALCVCVSDCVWTSQLARSPAITSNYTAVIKVLIFLLVLSIFLPPLHRLFGRVWERARWDCRLRCRAVIHFSPAPTFYAAANPTDQGSI